jgi:tetratricopeptide (TPR) repeat protein
MKKVLIFVVIFLFASKMSYSQRALSKEFWKKVEFGKSEFEKGNYRKALVVFDDLLKTAEKDSLQEFVADLYVQRAECNIQLKSKGDVCKDLETAIGFNILEAFILAKENCPLLVTSRMESELNSKLASKYFWDKEYDKAIPHYNKAIELYPYDELSISGRAMSFHETKQHDKELIDYSKLIEMSGDNPDYYSSRGRVFFEIGRLEESLIDLNKAINLDPSNFIHYMERGLTNRALKNYNNAISDFTRVIAEFQSSNIYLERAKSYLDIGDKVAACKDLKKITADERTTEVKELLKNCR